MRTDFREPRVAELEVAKTLARYILHHVKRFRPLDNKHKLVSGVDLGVSVPTALPEPVQQPIGTTAAVLIVLVGDLVENAFAGDLTVGVGLDGMLDLPAIELPEIVGGVAAEKAQRVRSLDAELRQQTPVAQIRCLVERQALVDEIGVLPGYPRRDELPQHAVLAVVLLGFGGGT